MIENGEIEQKLCETIDALRELKVIAGATKAFRERVVINGIAAALNGAIVLVRNLQADRNRLLSAMAERTPPGEGGGGSVKG